MCPDMLNKHTVTLSPSNVQAYVGLRQLLTALQEMQVGLFPWFFDLNANRIRGRGRAPGGHGTC